MADHDTSPASRRRFFRLALDAMRDGALDAARHVGQAASELSDALREAPSLDDGSAARSGRARSVRRTGEATTARTLVRPPGARDEATFLSTCERCHACVDACPEGAIVVAPPAVGPRLEGTPHLSMTDRACVMCPDVPCASACPTGALRPITVAALRIGTARVSARLCLNPADDPCDVCVETCPLTGSAIAAGPEGVPEIQAAVCTGCGLCVVACPSYPKALRVIPA